MNFKKIVAAIAAAAISVSAMAVNAFAADSVKVFLGSNDTTHWETINSDTTTITGEGDYSLTLNFKGYRTVGYFKIASEEAIPASLLNAVVTVKSMVVNDTINCELKQTEFALNKDGLVDVCFINVWDEPSNFVKNFSYSDQSSGKFKGVDSIDTITVNFNISIPEVVETEAPAAEEAAAETTAAPAETTAAPAVEEVATVEDAVVEVKVVTNDDEVVATPEVIATAEVTTVAATTTAPKTGNTAVAVIVSVMALAGAATVATKKRK